MIKITYPCPCCGQKANYIGVKKDDTAGVNYNKYICKKCDLPFGTIEMEQNTFRYLMKKVGFENE